MMKKYAVDFLCAFIITAVVFACLGLLTSEEFFNDAVVWDESEKTLQLFGTKFGLDEKSLFRTEKLFDFNDVLFAGTRPHHLINSAVALVQEAGAE